MTSGNEKAKILVVDDDNEICILLKDFLSNKGYKVWCANDGKGALDTFEEIIPDAVLMDIKMPVMDGLSALAQIKDKDLDIPVIMLTAYGDVQSAVRAMKLGAYDFLTKPLEIEEILFVLKRAIEKSLLVSEIKELKQRLGSQNIFEQMGNSKHVEKLQHEIERVAKTDYAVTIQGETGTGKEIVARTIHQLSHRYERPFLAIDCAAIPDSLMESELFGYMRGAFTGADRSKEGHFATASGGTLFLDEITNLSLNNQKKLLRVLQERKILPLGAKEDVEVDVRIISATNVPLATKVERNEFRQDLYYRLNEFAIDVPPLRKRKEDIIFLARRFLGETCQNLGKEVPVISEDAFKILMNYHYPGNVRELRNIVRQATLLCDNVLQPKDLPIGVKETFSSPTSMEIEKDFKDGRTMKEMMKKNVQEIEREVISKALEITEGNKSKAARLLKVDYKTLFYKAKQYGM